MAIALPTDPVPQVWQPRLIDFGGELVPSLGGESQYLGRLGNRHSVSVQLTPTQDAELAQAYISRLHRGRREGVLMPFPQLNLVIGSTGTVRVNGGSQAGSTIILDGFSALYPVAEGQFFSIVTDGRRYLYSAAEAATASAGGELTLDIDPMLRVSPSNNDLVELAAPKIEGFVGGDDLGWTIDIAGTVGLSFTITERA